MVVDKNKERDARIKQKATEKLTDTIDAIFECPICLDVIFNPVKCKSCEGFYCSGCSIGWKVRDNSCPACRAEPFTLIKVGKNE